MSLYSILINLIGIVAILFTLWWFFFSKRRAEIIASDEPIKILVKQGIYQPALIQIPKGKEIKLQFIRQDATPCAETVVFSKLSIAQSLPLNQTVEIVIPPQQPGELEFTCQMGMYRGKLLIV